MSEKYFRFKSKRASQRTCLTWQTYIFFQEAYILKALRLDFQEKARELHSHLA
jgi:hypothetical protein